MVEEALALSDALHVVHVPHVHRVVAVHTRHLLLQRVVGHRQCVRVARIAGHRAHVTLVETGCDVDAEVVRAWQRRDVVESGAAEDADDALRAADEDVRLRHGQRVRTRRLQDITLQLCGNSIIRQSSAE